MAARESDEDTREIGRAITPSYGSNRIRGDISARVDQQARNGGCSAFTDSSARIMHQMHYLLTCTGLGSSREAERGEGRRREGARRVRGHKDEGMARQRVTMKGGPLGLSPVVFSTLLAIMRRCRISLIHRQVPARAHRLIQAPREFHMQSITIISIVFRRIDIQTIGAQTYITWSLLANLTCAPTFGPNREQRSRRYLLIRDGVLPLSKHFGNVLRERRHVPGVTLNHHP